MQLLDILLDKKHILTPDVDDIIVDEGTVVNQRIYLYVANFANLIDDGFEVFLLLGVQVVVADKLGEHLQRDGSVNTND